jgi:HEAT repeat protein
MRPLLLCAVVNCCAMVATARPRAAEAPPLTPADVPALLAKLSDPNSAVRAQALRELRRVEPFSATQAALPRVVQLAKQDTDVDVRCEALATLGGYGDAPTALSVLEASLNDTNASVAHAAANSIPSTVAAWPLLRVAAQHPDAAVRRRRRSADRLRTMPSGPEVFAALEVALTDRDRSVRMAAAQVASSVARGQASLALALMNAARSETDELTRGALLSALEASGGVSTQLVPTLTTLLSDSLDERTRYLAAKLLGQLASKPTVPALIKAIEQDPAPMVRGFAAEALGRIGPSAREGLPALMALVNDRKRLNYRSMAVLALGAIDTTHRADVSAALRAAVADVEEETQAAALEVLKTRGAPSASLAKVLRELKLTEGSRNAKVWAETLEVLKLGVPRYAAARELIQRLSDDDELARGVALLEALRAPVAEARWQPGLLRCLREANPLHRKYAAQVLGRLEPQAQSAVPELVRALLEPRQNGANKRDYALALVAIGGDAPQVLDALGTHLERGEPFRADASAEALSTLGEKGVPALLRGVRSKQPYACFAAARALMAVGPPAKSAVPALLDLLGDASRLTVHLTDGGGTSAEAVRGALQAIAPDDARVRAALSN